MILIEATIGAECHGADSSWAHLSINGKMARYTDATMVKWLTATEDKQRKWCECLFDVPEGTVIGWHVGSTSGGRGQDKREHNLRYVARGAGKSITVDSMPGHGKLHGRLALVSDAV
jgi:hypothetical protein